MQGTTSRGWLEAYKRARESRDPQAAADLFAPDATYHETPFDGPASGRKGILEYWSEVPRSQENVTFSYNVIAVDEERGFSHWTANFRRFPSGSYVELDGILPAKLDDQGRCTEFREWWHKRETT